VGVGSITPERSSLDPTIGKYTPRAALLKATPASDLSMAREIERFEAAHPIGTKARLAFALLLYTGQRRSDVVTMGPQDIHHDVLTIDQGKTDGGEEAISKYP